MNVNKNLTYFFPSSRIGTGRAKMQNDENNYEGAREKRQKEKQNNHI